MFELDDFTRFPDLGTIFPGEKLGLDGSGPDGTKLLLALEAPKLKPGDGFPKLDPDAGLDPFELDGSSFKRAASSPSS